MVRARAKITDSWKEAIPYARPGTLAQERWPKGPRSPAHRDRKHPLMIQQYKTGETLEGHTSLENQLLPTEPVTSPPSQDSRGSAESSSGEKGVQLAMATTLRSSFLFLS